MIRKLTFSRFFSNLVKFNVSSVSGTAHVETVFYLFPCPGEHVWGNGRHAIHYSFPEMANISNFLRIHKILDMPPEEKVQRSHIRAPWWPWNRSFPSNPPVAETSVQWLTHTQTEVWRCQLLRETFPIGMSKTLWAACFKGIDQILLSFIVWKILIF